LTVLAFSATNVLTVVTVVGMVVVVGWLISVVARGSGRSDRRREEEARDYFTRHGRWPDEEE
jgi:hypothetical protein